ncbi:hypothetical protein E2C06_30540 [Dankookia rubra]|uniref:Uncharacterized protein n=1 Tax=Dankookia rubra TaxID=1442381 RepID=A0A4R5Q8H4_9PROT|nr:hypothetical protein [Dankookia rubra]TDH58809.1 hypothetical protein E2C06_30540 [Dankookia rubra]
MQDLTTDPLTGLLEARMDEALANGADMRELAAIAIDTILGEATQLLEQHAAALTVGMGRLQPHGFAYLHERAMRDGVLDAAERVLSMQFSGQFRR